MTDSVRSEMSVRIIGPGRAGRSFAAALGEVGVTVDLADRDQPVTGAAQGVQAVLIATPDEAIAQVAAAIQAGPAVVLHCSGAIGVGPLSSVSPHNRTGSVHPLMALPNPDTGARRLLGGGWFAVAGDPVASDLVDRLGGQRFEVADGDRAAYHATAAIAANHLVALLGQVERLATQAGVPVGAFFDLARGSFDDVVAHGAAAALTGPAARGDLATLAAHRQAIDPAELALYDALALAAADLAGETQPE